MTLHRKKDFLFLILFLIIFINGFESGGYQASLWDIGNEYALSKTSMGSFASMELLATMLAPIMLGRWADRTGKKKSITVLLALQIFSTVLISVLNIRAVFLIGIFVLGLTTSGLQFITIAALQDAYPVTGKMKIGYITSCYAFGAFIAPLCVRWYLEAGLGWRTLFFMLAITSVVACMGILKTSVDPREKASEGEEKEAVSLSQFIRIGIVLCCVIMCIYVGFENGFSFFIDTYMVDILKTTSGKIVLSVFWAVMMPARILAGRYAQHSKQILLASCIVIPVVTLLIALSKSAAMILLLVIPLGMASGAIYPCVLNLSFRYAGEKTATVTGWITASTGLGAVVFTWLTGYMSDRLGMQMAMILLAACFLVSIWAVCYLGQVDEMAVSEKKQSRKA